MNNQSFMRDLMGLITIRRMNNNNNKILTKFYFRSAKLPANFMRDTVQVVEHFIKQKSFFSSGDRIKADDYFETRKFV